MSDSNVSRMSRSAASTDVVEERPRLWQRGIAVVQPPLVKYFAALGQHPQLSTDLARACSVVLHPPTYALQQAKENRSEFLVAIATHWFERRYTATWEVMPHRDSVDREWILRHAVTNNWTWHDVVAQITKLGQRPRTSRTRVTVKVLLQQGAKPWMSDAPRSCTTLYDDLDGIHSFNDLVARRLPLSLSDPYVEVTHRINAGTTLEEYLASARRAWEQGHIKEHVFQQEAHKRAGNRKEYDEHVALYSKWYDHHFIQGRPTYMFVDAVTRGEVIIRGWASSPTYSAINQRLSDARRWLTPHDEGGCDSLQMLLRSTVMEDKDSFEVVSPDKHYGLTYRMIA